MPESDSAAQLDAANIELIRLAKGYAGYVGLDSASDLLRRLSADCDSSDSLLSTAVLRSYIEDHPEQATSLLDYISLNSTTAFPWAEVQGDVSGLAFLYNFVPFQDTGSTVASKRLREFGETVDVISCSMLYHKKVDLTVQKIVRPYLARTEFISMQPSWASWDAFQGFAARANKVAEKWVRQGRIYKYVYSRAMWAPSIYAAAVFKRRHPNTRWIVEFSDPLSLDVQGKFRGGDIQRSGLFQELVDDVPMLESFYREREPTIFGFAENLAYALADEIIFTNENQREVMLSAVDEQQLRERAEGIGRVSNHPTLPPVYYSLGTQPSYTEPEFFNIAYFGEFYAARGISEVMRAAQELPRSLRNRIRLHVFTNYAPGLRSAGTGRFSAARQKELEEMALTGVGVERNDPRVIFRQSLAYLDFLSAMKQFDVLVLSDAESGTGHEVNPYLPSKWSDYSGSDTPVWALVEEGSVLSDKPAKYMTARGSVEEARELLLSLITRKFAGEPE